MDFGMLIQKSCGQSHVLVDSCCNVCGKVCGRKSEQQCHASPSLQHYSLQVARSRGILSIYIQSHTHIYIHIDMYVHVQFHRVLGSEGCKQIEDHIIGNAVGCKVHLRGEAGDFSRVVEGTLSPPPTPVTTLRSMAQDETIRMSW